MTTKLEELKKAYAEMGEKIEAMEKQEIDYATWWPEVGDEYWGYTDACRSFTSTGAKRNSRTYTGGIFSTEEDRDTFVKVNERYYELMDGVVLDWDSPWHDIVHMVIVPKESTVTFSRGSPYIRQGASHMFMREYATMREEFTDAQLKLWITGGARR